MKEKDPYVQIIKACLPKKGLQVRRRGGLLQKKSPWDSYEVVKRGDPNGWFVLSFFEWRGEPIVQISSAWADDLILNMNDPEVVMKIKQALWNNRWEGEEAEDGKDTVPLDH